MVDIAEEELQANIKAASGAQPLGLQGGAEAAAGGSLIEMRRYEKKVISNETGAFGVYLEQDLGNLVFSFKKGIVKG